MKRACVLGSPVSHSLSPKLHGFWLKKHGITGEYGARACTPEELPLMLDKLATEGFAGCNLTLPLKETALPLMDELDESARASGTVNTVVFSQGKKKGYNSDGFGFMEGLKTQHPRWSGERVVVLGAGGAGRAIVAALKNAGARHFTIINRRAEKASEIICDLRLTRAEAIDWDDRKERLEGATLLVNCTPLGMQNQPDLDLDLTPLPQTTVVCDVVYRPLMTPLLEQAQMRGNPVVNGLPMLLHQGRLGFRHWFGQDPVVSPELYEEMAACVK